MHILTRITFNPMVMGGKPCIRGMHDLDFLALLAATQGEGPSVIQVHMRPPGSYWATGY